MFSVGDRGGLKVGAGVEDYDQNLLVEKCAQSSLIGLGDPSNINFYIPS